jgi:hypothetical protein
MTPLGSSTPEGCLIGSVSALLKNTLGLEHLYFNLNMCVLAMMRSIENALLDNEFRIFLLLKTQGALLANFR